MPLRNSKPTIVAAVHANRGVEAWYRDKLQQLIADMHASMLLHIRAAFNNAPLLTGFASDAPNSSILIKRALAKWGGLWTKKFNGLSLELSKKFADKTFGVTDRQMADALKRAGFTVAFKPTPASVEAYHAVVAQNVGLIKSIPKKYLEEVQTQVWDSVMKGADMSALTKNLTKTYGISHKRAAVIARTENHKAKAVLENERRAQLGITHAIWVHSGGGKEPRHNHEKWGRERRIFPLSEGIYDHVAGENVWPGTLINCRCTSRAVIPGLDD